MISSNMQNYISIQILQKISPNLDSLLLDPQLNAEVLKDFLEINLYISNIGEVQFDNYYTEAYYYYLLGNSYSKLYSLFGKQSWYSEELNKTVSFYRKTLDILVKNETDIIFDISELKSNTLTNLANHLSSQGRSLCCIQLYNEAIQINKNPVAIISKARNLIYVANTLFDPGHRGIYFFEAYRLIQKSLQYINDLFPEHREAIEEDGELTKFTLWFKENYDLKIIKDSLCYKHNFINNSQKSYFKWVASNGFFLNDLNDIICSEIVYHDVQSLPNISFGLDSLFLPEIYGLTYYSNFNEIKDSYCYARSLFFYAKNIKEPLNSIYSSTYKHIDDGSINNLKINHYKSSFKMLYSIFDKVAYLANRFFNLNSIEKDREINFKTVFRNIKKRQKWEPNEKLKENSYYYLQALFHIFKDIEEVRDSDFKIHRPLNPDVKEFVKVRNFMEHRSLKIIEDDNYENTLWMSEFLEEKDYLNNNDNQRMLNQSLIITVEGFEKHILSLMRLTRVSIIYLSLAINMYEREKRKDSDKYLEKELPLKPNN